MYISWLPHRHGGYYLAVIEAFFDPDHKKVIVSVQGGYGLIPQMDQVWSDADRFHYLNLTMYYTTVKEFASQPPPPEKVQELDGSSHVPDYHHVIGWL
jgi:hypothetical protein